MRDDIEAPLFESGYFTLSLADDNLDDGAFQPAVWAA
jgi:hypothetical protein